MRAACFLAVLSFALAGCGTTLIRASDPGARIWVDGRLAGVGIAKVTRRGLPHTTQILVQTADGRRASQEVSRSFTATTLIGGLLTSYVGMIALWELPETVTVTLPPGSSWDGDSSDVWMQPPLWAAGH
jgi:hypothetical protein